MAEPPYDHSLSPTKPSEPISASSQFPFADHATSSNETEQFLANPSPYHSTDHINSPIVPVANRSTPTKGDHVPQPPIETYGKSRRKKHLNETDVLAVIVVLLCLVAATVTISPRLIVAWRLGLKRQLQILGFLLSIMDLCLNVIAPKVFLMSEARFGHSYVQNYDAILRNSIVLSHTGYLWRAVLLAMIALPTGLSIAYKEFIEGSHNSTLKDTGGQYGLAAPGQVANVGGRIGVALMVNATLPFLEASANDSILPRFSILPQAYSFNMLLLSENSTAFLDGPMPDYVSSFQMKIAEGESQTVTTQVHATISTYNNTAESFRDDSSWWEYIGLLVNNFDVESPGDKSWCFLGIAPSGKDDPPIKDTFQYSALEFNTRRDLCEGNWTVTKDTVELAGGYCSPGSLPDSDQKIITNNTLAFVEYYMPTLSEFLGAFATERNTSEWLYPTFTTAVAAMYWSRMTALNGYYSWGPDKNLNLTDDPYHVQRSEVYYHVNDNIVCSRITMDPSWILYLVLAFQPALALILFLAALTFYQTPMDGELSSMIAVLSGVRKESLKLLEGASLSGRLSRPVRMKIAVREPVTATGKPDPPEIEYVLGGVGDNQTLSHSLRYSVLRLGSKVGSIGSLFGRGENQYEMFSLDSEHLHTG